MATGVFSYRSPCFRINWRPTQASSSRSRASGSARSSWARSVGDFGPAANASKTPSETAANIAFERRKACEQVEDDAGVGRGEILGHGRFILGERSRGPRHHDDAGPSRGS